MPDSTKASGSGCGTEGTPSTRTETLPIIASWLIPTISVRNAAAVEVPLAGKGLVNAEIPSPTR